MTRGIGRVCRTSDGNVLRSLVLSTVLYIWRGIGQATLIVYICSLICGYFSTFKLDKTEKSVRDAF